MVVSEADQIARHKPRGTDEPELSGAAAFPAEHFLEATARIEVQDAVRETVRYEKRAVFRADQADRLSYVVIVRLSQYDTILQDQHLAWLGSREQVCPCGRTGDYDRQPDHTSREQPAHAG